MERARLPCDHQVVRTPSHVGVPEDETPYEREAQERPRLPGREVRTHAHA